MNPDIRKAVQVIDQRIANLERIKYSLLEEFGIESPSEQEAEPRKTPARAPSARNGEGRSSRREQLTKFLTENGPASRGTIIDMTGIPKGTIASLLNGPGFVRNHGRWQVVSRTESVQEGA